MRRPAILFFICSLLVSSALFGQAVEIKPESLKKKERFRTRVELLSRDVIAGKLVEVNDSSIIVRAVSKSEDITVSINYSIICSSIRSVKLKHVTKAGMFAGALIGGAVGIIPAAAVSMAIVPINAGGGGTDDGGRIAAGVAAFGAIMVGFTAMGAYAVRAAGKGYVFLVDGSCERYREHQASLESMVIELERE